MKKTVFFLPRLVALGCLAGAIASWAWLHFHLPEAPVAIHFNAAGQADGFAPRDIAIGIFPVQLAVITLLFWVLPALMPENSRLERSATAYGTIWIFISLFITAINGMIIARALGVNVPVTTVILVGIGALYLILGNVMPKIRYNTVMGIRTPWTLASERVWDATHRFSGPVFMLGGLVLILGAAFAQDGGRVGLVLGLILGGTLIPACLSGGYSLWVSRRV